MSELIPYEVKQSYAITPDAKITHISGGSVNRTLLVDDAGERTIVQQIAPHYQGQPASDVQTVAKHLDGKGWEVPMLRPSTHGHLRVFDYQGNFWRSVLEIPHDGSPQQQSLETTRQAGILLGSWHHDVSDLTATFSTPRPHPYDSSYHFAELAKVHHELPMVAQHIGRRLLLESTVSPRDAALPQVTHGDPKLDNMLFRGAKPFTLIDFDTLAIGSPWADVGDFLRSLTGKLVRSKVDIQPHIETFVTSYCERADTGMSIDEAHYTSLRWTGHLVRTLSARYLVDAIRKSYFSHDESRGQSREEYHTDKARNLLRVAQIIDKELQLAS